MVVAGGPRLMPMPGLSPRCCQMEDLLLVMVVSPGDAELGYAGLAQLRRLGITAPVLVYGDGSAGDYPAELRQRLAAVAGVEPCWMDCRLGWAGLPQTMARVYAAAAARPGWRMLVKIDPDALVLDAALFSDLRSVLAAGHAMAGTFRFLPDGRRHRRGLFFLRPWIDCLPLGPLRELPSGRLRWLSFRRPRYARLGLMFAALRHGLRPGELILGGIYAVTREGLADAFALGFASDLAGPVGLYAIEDGLLSLYLAAAGHRLGDVNFNADGTARSARRAWIQWTPLPAELDPKHVTAVHPLKERDAPMRRRLLAAPPSTVQTDCAPAPARSSSAGLSPDT
jgi:hypothetical protein